MSEDPSAEPPLMQRLYDRIWLLALVAIVFWALSYVLWGFLDVFSVPPAPGAVAIPTPGVIA